MELSVACCDILHWISALQCYIQMDNIFINISLKITRFSIFIRFVLEKKFYNGYGLTEYFLCFLN